MTKQPKPATSRESTTHPETKTHVKPGLPDERSSKVSEKGRDARTGQDKDGNEEQSKGGARR